MMNIKKLAAAAAVCAVFVRIWIRKHTGHCGKTGKNGNWMWFISEGLEVPLRSKAKKSKSDLARRRE